MKAKPIIYQTKQILSAVDIHTGRILKEAPDKYILRICSKKDVLKFLSAIGFSNKRHITRIKAFNLYSPWLL